jgi:AcrR family transcriptional regulator
MIAPTRSHAGVEETRARILAATREIFERRGTRGTTTRDVAEKAGVNEATLFRHFGSKASLLVAMRERSCGLEEFRSIIDTLDGADIRADLLTIAHSSVQNMFAQRDLMCISLAEQSEAHRDGDGESPEWRGPATILELLSQYFGERIGERRLRGQPVLLARAFMGIMFQYVVARRLWGSDELDPAIVDFLVDLFLNGVQV